MRIGTGQIGKKFRPSHLTRITVILVLGTRSSSHRQSLLQRPGTFSLHHVGLWQLCDQYGQFAPSPYFSSTNVTTDKSNKKIAPKAQVQRRRPVTVGGPAAPEQSSARASTERRDSLQAPIPATTRPTQSGSPVSVSNHLEPRSPTYLFSRPSTAEETQTTTASSGTPIVLVSGESATTQPISRPGGSSADAPETPTQDSVRAARKARESITAGAKTILTARLSSGSAATQESSSVVVGDTAASEPASTAIRKSSGDEYLHQPASKRRKLDRSQNPKNASLTTDLSEANSSNLTTPVEQDIGPEVSTDEQALARENVLGRAAAAKSKQKTAASAATAEITQNDIEQTNNPSAPKRKGRARAKDKKSLVANTTSGGGSTSLGRRGSLRNRQKRVREKTPENAENIEITSSMVKMSDLCRDTRTGKRSERSKEIEKIDGTEVIRKQRERREVRENGRPPSLETVDQRLERLGREREIAEQGQISAPRMRLVNGKLVLDEASLQVDRHANAAAFAEPMEQVEESTLTRPVNAGTWGKREKTEPWDEDSTDRFYNALRMFGTDFGMISKMFPGRTRRQIKLKFNKEERTDSKRVTEILTGPRRLMDIAEFSEITMTEYQDPEAFARELEEEAAAYVAEQKRQQEALQETLRQTQTTTTAEATTDGVGGNSSAKENQAQSGLGTTKKGKRAADKKKKNLHSRNGGGEEVEIVGMIDR
ncbi:MAG: Transcription factor TFIIIB component B [Trichoglossum hirsutum]|nr:MAG: Transcription factor TFIIIB component B [Trichoglossum hirsutum]